MHLNNENFAWRHSSRCGKSNAKRVWYKTETPQKGLFFSGNHVLHCEPMNHMLHHSTMYFVVPLFSRDFNVIVKYITKIGHLWHLYNVITISLIHDTLCHQLISCHVCNLYYVFIKLIFCHAYNLSAKASWYTI